METNYSEPFIAVISAELMVFSCYQPIIYLKSRSKKNTIRPRSAISLLLETKVFFICYNSLRNSLVHGNSKDGTALV
jgi:hypothetical protein